MCVRADMRAGAHSWRVVSVGMRTYLSETVWLRLGFVNSLVDEVQTVGDACTHVPSHPCTNAQMQKCKNAPNVPMHPCTHARTYARTRTNTCKTARTSTKGYARMHAHTRTDACTPARLHARAHARTHTRVRTYLDQVRRIFQRTKWEASLLQASPALPRPLCCRLALLSPAPLCCRLALPCPPFPSPTPPSRPHANAGACVHAGTRLSGGEYVWVGVASGHLRRSARRRGVQVTCRDSSLPILQ